MQFMFQDFVYHKALWISQCVAVQMCPERGEERRRRGEKRRRSVTLV